MNRWHFSPRWPSTLVLILLFPALISLGMWQLERAQQKKALFARYTRSAELPPAPLEEVLREASDPLRRAVIAEGTFQSPLILLDNQIRDGIAGFIVLAPFKTQAGNFALVACGWLAAPADRARLPELISPPAGITRLTARLGPAPAAGIELRGSRRIERLAPNLLRIQQVDLNTLAESLRYPLSAPLLYLNSDLGLGYDRNWRAPSADVSKHQAYAVQWFAMAAVLFLLYVRINLRRKTP